MTKPEDVRKGDLMAFTYYGRIEQVMGDHLQVFDLVNEQTFFVNGADLIEKSHSADRYDEEIKVTKTEMATILMKSYHVPFTVVFTKQDGTERTLRGILIEPEPVMGRSKVEDLDITGGKQNRFRLVDHRSLISLTVGGKKYTLKGKK